MHLSSCTAFFSMVVCLCLGFANSSHKWLTKRAIWNGYKAPPRPFFAQLRKSGRHHCGAAIVGNRLALSAAHCYHGPDKLSIAYGDFSKKGGRVTTVKIKKGVIHPGYDRSNSNVNDIVAIKLASSVPNSAVIPMCTSDYSQYTLAVCGFGYVAANNKKFPSTLLETQLTELGQQCPFTQLDTSKLVCTRGQNTQTCPGDSGSPLFPVDGSNRAICHYGILSLGDCTPGRTDSLYTRVSAYQKWIKKYM
ncbi:fibrinolytic enzyme, isozyme C-like isoform X1 [Convolutriloba macropyga]|uniref:fibrinolytic enzyme, isozyme C-like isoform X1 n=1 Tax=Convolutriloba macropyga TaxID=536237 RepID=UPI003F51B2F9